MNKLNRTLTAISRAASAFRSTIRGRERRLLIQVILVLLVAFSVWVYLFLQPRTWRYYTDGLTFSKLARDVAPHFVAWEDATVMPDGFNTPAAEPETVISPDGTKMVFTRKGPNGSADLFISKWDGRDWSSPIPIRPINSKFNEKGPAFGRDGNSLYFATDRPGGPGGYDIWMSRWDGAEFAWPLPLTLMINSPFDDLAPEPSAKGDKLYFSSNRPTRALGKDERYVPARELRKRFKDLEYDIFVADRIPAGVTNREVERATSMLYYLRESALADPKIMTTLGGSARSEKAVDKALAWLAKVQEKDGYWDLRKHGGGGHNVGGTAFALLVFLGRGERPDRDCKYRDNVKRAIDWLISQQNPVEGELQGRGGNMYDHGIASLALAEAYGVTKHEDLILPAQAAIDFIVQCQNKNSGGWRYKPNSNDSDLSVSGWHIMALKSAQFSGLRVPADTMANIRKWLRHVSGGKHGGIYGYQNGGGNKQAMVATGYFCCQLMGLSPNTFKSFETADFIEKNSNEGRLSDSYFCYYATLSAYQNQGPLWRKWQESLQKAIPGRQDPKGYWEHTGTHANEMGRVVYSCLMALSLQAHYRYTPLYGLGYEPSVDKTKVSTIARDDLSGMPIYRRAKRLYAVSSPRDDIHVCATSHGDFLYFASDRSGGLGGFDIYRTRISGDSPSTPLNLGPTVNTKSDETGPALRMNGFNMIFGSNREQEKRSLYRFYSTTSRRVFQRHSNMGLPGRTYLKLVWKRLLALLLSLGLFAFLMKRKRIKQLNGGVTENA